MITGVDLIKEQINVANGNPFLYPGEYYIPGTCVRMPH